ncbi:MAG: choice-of-anchor R domain-containing protein [Limisphaerales bacterium]
MKTITVVINSLVLGSLAIATSAHANVIYNNLEATSSGADQVLYVGPLFDSFTPTSTETITSLRLALGTAFGPQTGTLEIGLYSTPANPTLEYPLTSMLGTINESTITSGNIEDYSVSLLANPVVTAGTRYWIGLTTDAGDIIWSWSTDTSGPGVAGEYFAFDGGSTVDPNSEGPYQMDLTGAPAPDLANPALLLALFGGGLVTATWRSLARRTRTPAGPP